MTVNTTQITSGPYPGNDIADTFDYDFRIEDKTQLIVYETDDLGVETTLTVDTDYTVAGLGVDGGGVITRTAGALPTGSSWYIRSNYSETQLTAFASQGGFLPAVHEAAMDKLTFLIQQIDDVLGRSIRLSESYSGGTIDSLPDPESEKFIRWKSDLSGFENALLGTSTVTLPIIQLSNYNSLSDAISDIGSTNVELWIDKSDISINTALVTPANIVIRSLKGFTLDGSASLTINGPFVASGYRVFGDTFDVIFGDFIEEVYLEWWGGSGDGLTDNTKAFEQARNSHNPVRIQLFPGTYLISSSDAVFGAIYSSTVTMVIVGFGAQATTIKNNNAIGGGIRFVSTECKLLDLEYDNGTSTGFGVLANSQYCIFENLEMRNQEGVSTWMLQVDGGTGTILNNVKILGVNVYNGFKIGGALPTGNIYVGGMVINKCLGQQVEIVTSSATVFDFLQLDEGGGQGAIAMRNCDAVTFNSLVTEFSSEVTLTGAAYITMDNSDSIAFNNTRINHLTGTDNKPIFRTLNAIGTCSNISIDGVEFLSDATGVTFYNAVGTDTGLIIKNINNNSNPSIVGLTTNTTVSNLKVSNWTDKNAISSHSIAATVALVDVCNSNIEMRSSTSNQKLISCSGILTGAGLPSVDISPPPTVTETSAGAILTQGITIFDSTAGAFAASLAAADVPGQIKSCRMSVNGGDVTLTVPNHKTTITFTFNAANDRIVFIWDGQSWDTLSSQNM